MRNQIREDSDEPQTYTCERCGHEITFDEAYPVSGKYCPNCDYKVNIPLHYWGK